MTTADRPAAPDSARQAGAPAGPPLRRRPGTRGRLFTIAAQLFRKNGFEATTTRQLADALGVNKASLYHHVTSKEALLHEMCVRSLTETLAAVSAEVAATAAPEPGAADPLRTLVADHMRTTLGESDIHAVALVELRALQPDHWAEVTALRDDYQRFVVATIEQEQAAGRVRRDLDPKTIALALLSLLNWTVLWYRPTGDLPIEALVDAFSAIFFEGVRA